MQMAYSEQLLFNKKIDLFFEIPSLFTGYSRKVPKGVPGVPGVQKCFL